MSSARVRLERACQHQRYRSQGNKDNRFHFSPLSRHVHSHYKLYSIRYESAMDKVPDGRLGVVVCFALKPYGSVVFPFLMCHNKIYGEEVAL
jgi:hypothetical protein